MDTAIILDQSKVLIHVTLGADATVHVEGGDGRTPSLVIKAGTSEIAIYPDGDLSTAQLDFADALATGSIQFRDDLHGLAGPSLKEE